MPRLGDPTRWMLGGLLAFAAVLYWFLPRPEDTALDRLTGKRKTVVTVMGGFVERDRQIWQAVEESFEREHPHIDLKVLRGAGEPRKVDTMIAGGVAPDVLKIDSTSTYYYVGADALLDLAAFVASDPQLTRDICGYADESGRLHKPDYFDFAIDAFRGEEGQLYALPTWYCNFFVYYNKNLFDKYNVPYPDEDWDWQGFRERCIALTRDKEGRPLRIPKRDHDGRVVTDERGWVVYERNPEADDTPHDYGFWFATWQHGPENLVRQNKGRFIADRGLPSEHLVIDHPDTRAALWFLYELSIVNQCQPRPSAAPGAGLTVGFKTGRVAMMGPEGVFRLLDYRDQCRDFEWDVAPQPKGPDGVRASLVLPTGLGVSRQCEHPQAAFEFVKWFAGPHGARILGKWPLFIPARRSFALSEEYFLDPATKPDSDWAMVHDVSYPYVDPAAPDNPEPGDGYAFLPEAASVRHHDVYEAINVGLADLFYYRNFTDDQFKAFAAEHGRQPTEEQALELHQAALDQALEDIRRNTERAYRWAQRRREQGDKPAAWPMWTPLVAVFLIAVGLVGWRAVRNPYRPGPLERRQQYWGYLLISPWLIGFVGLTAGPILFSVGLSLCKWQSLTSLADAEFVGVENYVRALRGDDPLFYKSLKATLQYTLFAVPLHVVGGLVLALMMNTKLRGIKLWRTFYFIPAVLPVVAVVVLYHYLFNPEQGWVNHVLRLVGWSEPPKWPVSADPVLGIPAAMWMFVMMSLWAVGGSMIIYLGSLQGIPTQLYEAAEVDGAGRLGQLRHVTLPMISPVLFFMLIMGIIGSFQVFTTAYVLFDSEGGPRNSTLFYVLHLFNEAVNRYRFGYGAALAWILFVIILVLTAVVFKSSPMWVYYEGARERRR